MMDYLNSIPWDQLVFFGAKYLIFSLFVPLFYFWAKDEHALVWRALFAIGVAEALVLALNILWPVPRPFESLGITKPELFLVWDTLGLQTTSFPSGHTAIGVALSVAVMGEKKLLGRFLLLLALAVGVARYLGLVHYWWDIVGGVAVGVMGAVAVGAVARRWENVRR